MVCVILMVFVSNNEADVNDEIKAMCLHVCNKDFNRCLQEENCYQRKARRRKFPLPVSTRCIAKRSNCIDACLAGYKFLQDRNLF